MGEIVEIFNDFKTEVERQQFITKQHEAISQLLVQNRALSAEVEHLKTLLTSTVLIEHPTVTIEKSLEELLIDTQIGLIKLRGMSELTLEDVKKLDLLLKNKSLIKSQDVSIQAESKKLDKKHYTNAELIKLASVKNDNP